MVREICLLREWLSKKESEYCWENLTRKLFIYNSKFSSFFFFFVYCLFCHIFWLRSVMFSGWSLACISFTANSCFDWKNSRNISSWKTRWRRWLMWKGRYKYCKYFNRLCLNYNAFDTKVVCRNFHRKISLECVREPKRW